MSTIDNLNIDTNPNVYKAEEHIATKLDAKLKMI